MKTKVLIKDLNGNLICEFPYDKKINIEIIEEENNVQRVITHKNTYISHIEHYDGCGMVCSFKEDSLKIELKPVEKDKQ